MYASDTNVVSDVGGTTDQNLRAGVETSGWIATSSYRGTGFVPRGTNPAINRVRGGHQRGGALQSLSPLNRTR